MPNITIQWLAGRTDQERREIIAVITDAMARIGRTTADQIHIVFRDVEKVHWGVQREARQRLNSKRGSGLGGTTVTAAWKSKSRSDPRAASGPRNP